MSIRVLVTDDSTFMRTALVRALEAEGGMTVVARARNGKEAVELAKQHQPDVITMDIEMPEMDGLTALRKIMRESPTRVLMCSSLTTEGSVQSMQALRMGAADVIAKDNGPTIPGSAGFLQEFVKRVKAIGASKMALTTLQPQAASPRGTESIPDLRAAQFDVVLIGSSTGGPPVLETLLTAVPVGFPLPVIVAQHMPMVFTRSMANRLGEICSVPVRHLDTGESVRPGHIMICPGGLHTHVRGSLKATRVTCEIEPSSFLYKPSVDVLFQTAAAIYGSRVLGIVLTGIGEDGAIGAQAIRSAGGTILSQDQASCVVYGMPRAVAERQLSNAILSPSMIARVLSNLAQPPVSNAA
jgi:two-component system chemotaxis response regulator CheB